MRPNRLCSVNGMRISDRSNVQGNVHGVGAEKYALWGSDYKHFSEPNEDHQDTQRSGEKGQPCPHERPIPRPRLMNLCVVGVPVPVRNWSLTLHPLRHRVLRRHVHKLTTTAALTNPLYVQPNGGSGSNI